MSINYAEMQALASQGISFFAGGKTYKLITNGGVTVDPLTGDEIRVPQTQVDITGAIRDVNYRDIDGENIMAGDKRGIFDHSVPIKKDMRVLIDGELYRVVNPRPIKTADDVVAYRPILRRVAVPNG